MSHFQRQQAVVAAVIVATDGHVALDASSTDLTS